MRHNLFRLAKKVSKKSPSIFKLGCVITDRKHKVLSVGFNDMNKTHPKSKAFHKAIHAELDALLGLSYSDLKDGHAYVYRELQNGDMALSKPCIHCEEMLKRAGIKKVYYTDNTGYKSMKLK